MFSSEILFAKSGSSFYNGQATQSARFNSGSSSYLSFTPSGNGDRRQATVSFWFKKTGIGETYPTMFCCNDSSSGHYMTITFYEDSLYFQTAPLAKGLITTAKYRDTTAWYHCCWAIDTEQSTASNRVKCYINGTQITDFSTEQYPDEDSDLDICSTTAHAWGYFPDYGRYFNGYIADAYIIDGQQLTPSSFTETKEGVLIPKAYEGSYGTNGVHLEFKQTGTGTASTSTIGADTSGNTHHYTSSGMDSHDSNLPDCPEVNFCTFAGQINNTGQTLTFSEGNLEVASSSFWSSSVWNRMSMASMGGTTGKYYAEFVNHGSSGGGATVVGVGSYDALATSTTAHNDAIIYYYNTIKQNGTSVTLGGNYSSTPGISGNEVVRMAWDCSNGKVWIGASQEWFDVGSGVGDPANGNNPTGTISNYEGSSIGVLHNRSTNTGRCIMNFGQNGTFNGTLTAGGYSDANGDGNFFYSVPSGFICLSSKNLPEPTIGPNSDTQVDSFFNPYGYTADNTDNKARTGMGFQPDFLWFKDRDTSFSHTLYDSNRGANKFLQPNSTNAEGAASDLMSSFDSDGFTTQEDSSSGNLFNYSSDKYIVYSWKANGGTTTTNDASATSVGTIDSVYQANTTSGFSIVTYTGTGSAGSIAHGLGAVPKFIIIKNRDDSANWRVYHGGTGASDPETDYMYLNLNNVLSDGVYMNDTAPTSTVFSIGTHNDVGSSGDDYIAYLWAEIEGYQKFGKLTGNGNANGTYVHCGFQPSFVIIKQSSALGDWNMIDTTRQGHNHANGLPVIRANSGAVEEIASGNQGQIDILSNGFKLRSAHSSFNTSSATIVYMAWAKMPEKYSLAF